MAKTTPRGIRNNNPGNIRKGKDRWQGLAEDQSGDPAFAVFRSPAYGIRAMAIVLITYFDKYDLSTVRELIGRWAPSNENNTIAYVEAVADEIGREPDDVLDLHTHADLAPLVKAIIRHENGVQPYSQEEIDEGLKLAGVVKKSKAPSAETVGVGAGAVGTTTLLAYSELKDTARSLREQGEAEQSTALIAFAGGLSVVAILVLAAAGYFVWRKARARRT